MNRKVFYDVIRPMFPRGLSSAAVARMEPVLDDLDRREIPVAHKAYILGTAHHETDQWKTLEEYASGAAYEGRKDLGNTVKGDGRRFKGRGYVQITGRRNYSDWSRRLGVDLLKNPELAADPRFAVKILVDGMLLGTFTGKRVADFKSFREMRAVVNGRDRAQLIAGYAARFQEALEEASTAPTPVSAPKTPASPTSPPTGGIWAVIARFIASLFASKASRPPKR